MNLNSEIQQIIEKSVLCWLATVSHDGQPSVSPKEVFCQWDEKTIIVANIASPHSIYNIRTNKKVCLSVLDILLQKGYKLYGEAEILDHKHEQFEEMHAKLSSMIDSKFEIISVIRIVINKSRPILAPTYLFQKNVSEEEMIQQAKVAYGFNN